MTNIDTQLTANPSVAKIVTNTGESEEFYSNFLQGNITNIVSRSSYKQVTQIKDSVDNFHSVVIFKDKNTNVTIYLNDLDIKFLDINTQRVYDFLVCRLSSNLDHRYSGIDYERINEQRGFIVTVSEFMEDTGLEDRKEATKQLKDGLNALYKISLTATEKNRFHTPKGDTKPKFATYTTKPGTRILSFLQPLANGEFAVKFDFDIALYLSGAFYMKYPKCLLKINIHKNPHSLRIGRFLMEHHRKNYGKQNVNRIDIPTLLEICPELPTEEKVKTGQYTKRIRAPFERDLIALTKEPHRILSSWHYEDKNGIRITEEQVKKKRFKDWKTWTVVFNLLYQPVYYDLKKRYPPTKEEKQLEGKQSKTNVTVINQQETKMITVNKEEIKPN